ncbi:MAG: translation initiation factor IF-2 [Bacillota bacterium]
MSKIKVYELTSELDKLASRFFEQIKTTQLQLGERVHVLRDLQDQLKQTIEKQEKSRQAVEPSDSVPEAANAESNPPPPNESAVRNVAAADRPQSRQQTYSRPQGQQQARANGGFSQGRGFAQRPPAEDSPGRAAAARKPGKAKPINAVLPPAQEKEKVSNYDPNRSAYSKDNQSEKKPRSKKAVLKKINDSNGFEDRVYGSRRPKRKAPEKTHIEPIHIEKAVITAERVTVKTLAEKIGKPAADIIKKLFLLDVIATINQEIDFDTANLIAAEYGITLEQKLEKTFEEVLIDEASEEEEASNLVPRSPVVTIMGHVDHGKTTLLDAIRYSRVAEHEAGGITQHIGAYTVDVSGKTITFLDTPGHEAFTAMRARGAQVTDIAILVVAADDGIMPQTVEAINHAQAAGVPIIIAINKMDRPSANPDRIKQELTEYGIVAEEWGGDAVIVPVSAVTKEGLDHLLEMILLVADMQELKANPNRLAKGTIIEAKLDKGRGPVATVLVQTGTLKVGDTIVAGTAYGRVRAMNDDKGAKCEAAGPSQPVEVLGFSEVPEAGDILYAVEVDKLSRQVAQERRDKMKVEQLKAMSKVSLDDLFAQIAEGQVKELRIIIKADVQGSVEAVRQALEKLSNPEVRIKTIHGGVGAINEADIMLASASNAIIIGFNVRPNVMARQAAEMEKVDVRTYRVIYNAIEDIEKAMKGMLEPTFREVMLGHVQVRDIFRISGVGTIAGCYVTDGKIMRNAQVRVLRDDVVIHEGKIDSLRRFKDDVREVAEGYECGVGLVNFNDIKEGDVFEIFVEEEVER